MAKSEPAGAEPKKRLKQGRLSNEDIAFIRSNVAAMPVAEIAARLSRTVESIEEAVKVHCKAGSAAEIQKGLRASEEWGRLRDEFSPDEIKFLEEQYVARLAQYGGDVLPTEATQTLQAIKLETLQHRNLVARREIGETVKRLQMQHTTFLARFDGDYEAMEQPDRLYLVKLDDQIQACHDSDRAYHQEYVKLQERCDNLMRSAKSTRDQRLKKYEDKRKIDFMGIIERFQQKDVQEAEGRQMALMKLAVEKERLRLGEVHVYGDGLHDRPLLTPETTVGTEP